MPVFQMRFQCHKVQVNSSHAWKPKFYCLIGFYLNQNQIGVGATNIAANRKTIGAVAIWLIIEVANRVACSRAEFDAAAQSVANWSSTYMSALSICILTFCCFLSSCINDLFLYSLGPLAIENICCSGSKHCEIGRVDQPDKIKLLYQL